MPGCLTLVEGWGLSYPPLPPGSGSRGHAAASWGLQPRPVFSTPTSAILLTIAGVMHVVVTSEEYWCAAIEDS